MTFSSARVMTMCRPMGRQPCETIQRRPMSPSSSRPTAPWSRTAPSWISRHSPGELTPEDLGLGGEPAAAAAAGRGHGADDRRRIEQLLLETGGSVSQAAERLGLSRQALYRRMEKLGISLERRPK